MGFGQGVIPVQLQGKISANLKIMLKFDVEHKCLFEIKPKPKY